MSEIITDPFTGRTSFCPGIGYSWRTRDGGHREVQYAVPEITKDEHARCERLALESGWPGHRGDRWSYFKDDARVIWRNLKAALSPDRTL